MTRVETIGIIGAGKLGITLAQLALKAGYVVHISGSGDPTKIKLAVSVLAPGAVVMTSYEVAHRSDVIVLALPLGKFRQLPKDQLADKLVIDAMNYWWEVDGPRSELLPDSQSSSEAVQEFLTRSRLVKALSHMGYHNLFDEALPPDRSNRKAIAIAGDDQKDLQIVSHIVSQIGFDPVVIGALSSGRQLEPGSPVFGANLNKRDLIKTLTESR